MQVYKNGKYITRQQRKDKKQIKIAVLVAITILLIAIVLNIKVYL